ncbi:hypothetical protein KIPE111705_01780 [Kibdelosporangium persicum]|uniref:Uncharacterized protein n=1 Tax=Kibdelosporangium persicum TaxID=2698649 RepID=A0ABX2F6Q4_9PSEU|nr:hypothetical protein [Kibdelosporangium persicum]NRN66873.1 hypothetical protein [Kibdelosporangium persicum]
MATVTRVLPWTITAAGDVLTFTYAADGRRHSFPRVWNGRGLGVTEADLPAFTRALAQVPGSENVIPSQDDRTGETRPSWSQPRYDQDESFVYITGPCHLPRPLPGYAPTSTFTIDIRHIAALRARLTAFLRTREKTLSPRRR